MKRFEPNEHPFLPARLTCEQAAALMGMQPEHITILVRHGLLKPLGNPPENGHKYFAAAIMLELSEDVKWLTKASDCLVRHNYQRNAKCAAKAAATNINQEGQA